MSAIYGFIKMDGSTADIEMLNIMSKPFQQYSFDNHTQLVENNIALGYYKQEITLESVSEILPYHDIISDIYIVADVILDNRKELLYNLNMLENDLTMISDSYLILEAYKKWHVKCLDYLIGDFAFVIFDCNKKEVFATRDHVGKRVLYYTIKDNVFAFSTIMNPLLSFLGKKKKDLICEEYMAYFIANPTVLHEIDPKLTMYNNIFYVRQAYYMRVKDECIIEIKFWDPFTIKTRKYKHRTELLEEFKDIFEEAVRCRLRCIKNVGVMLSGGLDSSSVACISAKILSENNSSIYGYTSIPNDDYKDYLPKSLIANESNYTNSITDLHDNVITKFLPFNTVNSYNTIHEILDIYEQPYKFIENGFWCNGITLEAKKDQVGVLLDGQFGNLTVSYSDMFQHISYKLIHFKLISLFKDLKGIVKLLGYSKKSFLKYMVMTYIGTISYREKGGYAKTYLNKEIAEKYDVDKKLISKGYSRKNTSAINVIRKMSINDGLLNQMASFETKAGLKYNIIKRDPTRDKRIIEFCYSLSDDSFIHNGIDRALIRQSMIGTVPNRILNEYRIRGKQSADFIQRLRPDWDRITSRLRFLIYQENATSVLDTKKLEKIINEININDEIDKEGYVRDILIATVYLEAIRKEELE